MKTVVISALAISLLAACNGNADKKDNPDSTGMSNHSGMNDTTSTNGMNGNNSAITGADQEFVNKVAVINSAEIEAGRLASQKGSAQGVKDYGQMMVTDHTDAQAQLKSVATGMNITDSNDEKHRMMKAQLEKASGKNFDKAYIDAMISGHRDAIALFEQQAATGQNSALKNYASTMLPHLKMHLEKAQSLSK